MTAGTRPPPTVRRSADRPARGAPRVPPSRSCSVPARPAPRRRPRRVRRTAPARAPAATAPAPAGLHVGRRGQPVHRRAVRPRRARRADADLHQRRLRRAHGGDRAGWPPATPPRRSCPFLASPQGPQGLPPWLDPRRRGGRAARPGTPPAGPATLDAGSYVLLSLSPDATAGPTSPTACSPRSPSRAATAPPRPPPPRPPSTLGAGGTLAMTAIPAGATAILLRQRRRGAADRRRDRRRARAARTTT